MPTLTMRLGTIFGIAGWCAITLAAVPDKVTYQDHVQPIFRAHCASCHNPEDKNSDLDVMTYSGLMAGGASGQVVAGGDPGSSRLFKLVSHAEEPKMPPDSPKIPDAEVAIVEAWIAGGLLEKSDSKAMLSNKPKKALALASTSLEKPQGPIAFPTDLLIEPVIDPDRGSVVSSIATSPWAPVIAVAAPRQVLLYHSDTFELLGVLPFPEGFPHVLKFSRNGSLLLVGGGRGGQSGRVALFDVTTGERVTTIGDEYDAVLAADVSSDQQMVALGGASKIVRIYSTKTGEVIHSIKKHTDWVTALEFSPDSVLLASGDRSGGLHVWETFSGQLFYTLAGHKGAITDVTWRADANVVAAASEDTTVSLWEMFNGTQVKSFAAHGGGTLSVEFSKDGRLVTAGRDNTVKLWDGNGAGLRTYEAFSDIATATTFTHDALAIVGGDWSGEIRVWKTEDGARLANLSMMPPTIAERIATTEASLAELQPKYDEAAKVFQAAQAAQQQAQAYLDAAEKTRVEAEASRAAADKALADARTMVQTTTTQINEASATVAARRAEAKVKADAVAAEKAALEQAQAALAIAEKSVAMQSQLTTQITSVGAAARQSLEGTINAPKVEEAAKLLDMALAHANEALAASQAEKDSKATEVANRTNVIRDAAALAAASLDQVGAAEKAVADLTTTLQSAESAVASAGQTLTNAQAALDQATQNTAAMAQAVQAATDAVNTAKAAADASLAALEKVKSDRQKWEVAKTRVGLHKAKEVASQAQAKQAELAARAAESKKAADAVGAELAAAQKTLADGPASVESAKANIAAAQAGIDTANTQLEAAKTAHAKKEALRSDFEAQSMLIQQAAQAEPTNQSLAAALTKANETIALLTADRDAAAKDIEAKAAGVTTAMQAKTVAETAVADLEKVLAELPARIAAITAKHTELAAVAAAHQSETDAASAELASANQSVEQIHQQIASLTNPPAAAN